MEITLAKAVFTINLESMKSYKETMFSFSHVSCLSVLVCHHQGCLFAIALQLPFFQGPTGWTVLFFSFFRLLFKQTVKTEIC